MMKKLITIITLCLFLVVSGCSQTVTEVHRSNNVIDIKHRNEEAENELLIENLSDSSLFKLAALSRLYDIHASLNVRSEALKSTVNQYSQSSVDNFNQIVDPYNNALNKAKEFDADIDKNGLSLDFEKIKEYARLLSEYEKSLNNAGA